jgi:hypothetical protein
MVRKSPENARRKRFGLKVASYAGWAKVLMERASQEMN